MMAARAAAGIALLSACVPANVANALEADFTPTEAEWASWPAYCKANYVVATNAGRGSIYVRRVPTAEVERHRRVVGPTAWYWMHHFCAGLIYMLRADDPDPDVVSFYYANAELEIKDQYQRVPPQDPFFGHVVVALGRLYRETGQPQKALDILAEGMSAAPAFASNYTLASLVLSDQGKDAEAREILFEGNERTGGESAEIHYFLGLLIADSGELDAAVDHARQAYRLGYPLPGLRNKLKRLGRSLD